MIFEEMQKIIEGMLALQRDLQESQLELKERQLNFEKSQETQKQVLDKLIQGYGDLTQQSIRQKEILDRLIGYSLTNESEHLSLEE